MQNNLLIFGRKNFNNSLDEIKEYLDFSIVFYNGDYYDKNTLSTVNAVLVDCDVCSDLKVLDFINNINTKPLLLIEGSSVFNKCKHTDRIYFPFILSDLNKKIINLISTTKFNKNSSIKIKDYTIDKNEKKIRKKNLSIVITEREIQLIELLFNEKKPLPKNIILKKIWKYSDYADTHTVETHIYRLRKKILIKFKDDNFIINSKTGYTI